MISLFVDTSNSFITLALLKNENVIGQVHEKTNKQLSEKLFPLINEILQKANIKINQIEKLYVVTGPGSFTAIRIGVTFAKTLAWSLQIPVVALSSLEVMASMNHTYDYVVSCIDARREFVYAGIYDKNLNSYLNDQYISLEVLKQQIPLDKTAVFIGYELDEMGLAGMIPEIQIEKLIAKHKEDKTLHAHALNPNYLKNTEAEEKWKEKNHD